MENWFEERKKEKKENRRNLDITGNYRTIRNIFKYKFYKR